MEEKNIEIYFKDLSAQKQQEILDVLGDNGNYDVYPIAVIPVGGNESDDDAQGI